MLVIFVAKAVSGFKRLCFGIGRLQVMKRCKGYAKVICWAALRSYLETLQLSKIVDTTYPEAPNHKTETLRFFTPSPLRFLDQNHPWIPMPRLHSGRGCWCYPLEASRKCWRGPLPANRRGGFWGDQTQQVVHRLHWLEHLSSQLAGPQIEVFSVPYQHWSFNGKSA